MSDRFAAMQAKGPCPTCGTSAGKPTYRPDDSKPLSVEALEAHAAFNAKKSGRPNSE